MKLAIDFGRWTTTKTALAIAGVLAIGGAVGSAVAISPVVSPPIKWGGGFEAGASYAPPGWILLTTVPAGRNLLITDITVSNFGSALSSFWLYRGGASGCIDIGVERLRYVAVPPENVTHLTYQTGIGFGPGQQVCVGHSSTLTFNVRGFFFTAAP